MQTLSSQLIANVFEPWESCTGLRVLDFGGGAQATLEFLARYQPRVYFADLLAEPDPAICDPHADEYTLSEGLQSALALPRGLQFDVILFWDFMHYLPPNALQALSAVLYPHVHVRTRGYGFGALRSASLMHRQLFSIVDDHTLRVEAHHNDAPFYGHTQQLLNERFGALNPVRATLLKEGRLELLFSTAW